jgi:hypothetical protein
LNHQSEWGLTVSEGAGRRTFARRALVFGAYALFGAAALLAMPVVAGFLFFPESQGLSIEVVIVALCLILAIALKFQSEKTQRNSIQIDYRAMELRLGTQKQDGTFIREKVFSFRDIDDVQVNKGPNGAAKLCLSILGNDVAIDFNGADMASVEGLKTQIIAARQSALAAPIRSRIQSRAHSVEASFREIKSRVQSRIGYA